MVSHIELIEDFISKVVVNHKNLKLFLEQLNKLENEKIMMSGFWHKIILFFIVLTLYHQQEKLLRPRKSNNVSNAFLASERNVFKAFLASDT